MNIEKIKESREKVDKIFNDMEKELNKLAIEDINELDDESDEDGYCLADVISNAGITVEELTSSKFRKVMENMSTNDLAIMSSLKQVIPLFLVKIGSEFKPSSEKLEELTGCLIETAHTYTYAFIKMNVTEDISYITRPGNIDGINVSSQSVIDNKVIDLLAGYYCCMLGITCIVLGEDEADAMEEILSNYVSTIISTFIKYVKIERQKNGFKEE